MEKKELKKQLKACKKQIKRSNIAVRGFMKQQKFKKGSYGKLQHIGIWEKAKEQLLEYNRLKGIDLICPYCKRKVVSNPILHHIRYNWTALFTPANVIFLHYACHNKLHSDLQNKRKRKWKKGIRKFE